MTALATPAPRLRTLIVDDEPPARRGLRALLAAHDDVEVIGEAGTGRDAVAAIESLRPDLVLLDVQMPDGDGLEVLRWLGPGRLPAVIFTTAFDEYALAAFDAQAVDYLLKPYDRARFEQALERARRQLRARAAAEPARTATAAATAFSDRIPVRDGVRTMLVPVAAVECVEAEENYVRIWVGERSLLVRDTLRALAARLDPGRFLRVHRSWIVPVAKVVQAESLASGEYVLTLASGRRITTGRTYRAAVREALGL